MIKIINEDQTIMLSNIINASKKLMSVFNKIKDTLDISEISFEDKFNFFKSYAALEFEQEVYRGDYDISKDEMNEIINISLEDMDEIYQLYIDILIN